MTSYALWLKIKLLFLSFGNILLIFLPPCLPPSPSPSSSSPLSLSPPPPLPHWLTFSHTACRLRCQRPANSSAHYSSELSGRDPTMMLPSPMLLGEAVLWVLPVIWAWKWQESLASLDRQGPQAQFFLPSSDSWMLMWMKTSAIN